MTAPNNYTRRVANSNKTKKNKTQHTQTQCGSPRISSRTFQLLKHCWNQICKNKSSQDAHTKEEPNQLTTEDIANICKTSMYSYIPEKIKTEFESTSQQGIKRMGIELPRGRKANIYIAVPKQDDEKYQKQNKKMPAYMNNVIAWLQFASEHASPDCAKTLDIYLLLGDAKKELPDIDGDPIDRIHANTAFTTSCSAANEIFVFRREEWFKVFIHETFHCLGLDFSASTGDESNKRILSLFPAIDPKTDIRLYETYCEMWAEVFHLMFCLFTSTEGRHCVAFSESAFRRALLQEQRFSIYQSNKILNHAGYEYKDLFSSSPSKSPYREKTQAFSYYVIKSIMLLNLDAFIEWCCKYSQGNKTTPIQFDRKSIANYCDFVEDLVKRKNKSYECMVNQFSSQNFTKTRRSTAYLFEVRGGLLSLRDPALRIYHRQPSSPKKIPVLFSLGRKRRNNSSIENTLRMTSIDPKWY